MTDTPDTRDTPLAPHPRVPGERPFLIACPDCGAEFVDIAGGGTIEHAGHGEHRFTPGPPPAGSREPETGSGL